MDHREKLREIIASVVRSEVQPLRQQVTDWGSLFAGDRGADPLPNEQRGIAAARMVRAIAYSKGDPERAKRYAEKAWNDSLGKTIVEYFAKANSAGDFDSGGFMIPPEVSNEILDLLRPRSVIRAAGAPVVPMPRGTLALPKQTGDVSANYIGENEDITKSEPTGGQILLSAKKLSALVPISNDLLMYAGGDRADQFVRNSIVRRIATREDRAFLRDDGTQSTPKGLRFWALAANQIAQTGTTAADIESDLVGLIQALEGANVDMTGPVWIMSPRSKNHLINLRDANGNLIYPEIRSASPTLYSFPVFLTNNVPSNLGGGSNETEVYLVNIPDTLIGESGTLEITADSAASYVEGGNLVSAFSRDQTVIRAIVRHDFAVLYQEAVAVLTGVTWGA